MQLNKLNPENRLEAFSEIILPEEKIKEIIRNLKKAKWHKEQSDLVKIGEAKASAFPIQPTELEINLVELTKEEIAEALMRARQAMSAEIQRKKWAEKISKPQTYKLHTLETIRESYLNTYNSAGEKYVLDKFSEPVFNELALYFLKDENCRLDLKKGICLYGNVGCGKTSLMEFFKYNQTDSYILTSCRDVTYNYSKNGDEAIKRYNGLIPFMDTHLSYGQNQVGVCFDDLGTEDDRKHFGNMSNVMADIFLNRYDNKQNLVRKTHFTTNLTAKEIEERYGSRVFSRMKEIFNLVSFNELAKDRRK